MSGLLMVAAVSRAAVAKAVVPDFWAVVALAGTSPVRPTSPLTLPRLDDRLLIAVLLCPTFPKLLLLGLVL